MKCKYICKNTEIPESLRQYVQAELFKFNKYQTKPWKRAQFVFSNEGHDYRVEILVEGVQLTLRASAQGNDFYVAVDSAIEKILSQMRKKKKKTQSHKKFHESRLGRLEAITPSLEHDYSRPHNRRKAA